MKKYCICAVALLLCLFLGTTPCMASEVKNTEESVTKEEMDEVHKKLLEEFDFREIDRVLEEALPDIRMDFGTMVERLVSGDMVFSLELLWEVVEDQLFYEFRTNKASMMHILLIAITAAVFTNFSNIFKNSQIAEMGFYVLYILLITLTLHSFGLVLDSISGRIELLVEFMKILGPTYFLAVAFAKGSVTSVGFYQLVLFLIFLVELVILNILIPLIQMYIMIKLLNHLSGEEMLSKFAELLETIVTWSLHTLLTCVVGLNVIQGMLSPAIDGVKRNLLTKGAEIIPGIGDALGGMSEVVIGTAVLLKNGIGTAGMIICIAICAVPLVELLFMTLMYKVMAAVVQPISDKRIVECLSSIGDGSRLLVKLMFSSGLLFLITIVVVAVTTSA